MQLGNNFSNLQRAHSDAPSVRQSFSRLVSRLRDWPGKSRRKMSWDSPRRAPMFFEFMNRVISQLRQAGKMSTAESYVTAFNSFSEFCRFSDMPLSALTADVVKRYEQWLIGCGLKRNTASAYMRTLRAVYNRAVKGGLAEQNRPFRDVYTGVAKTLKRALTRCDIRRIKQLKLPLSSPKAFARDMFMLSFYLRGMSFIDMAYLRKSDIKAGILTYTRRKTGQILYIKWEKCMQEIVSRNPSPAASMYLLPIIDPAKSDHYRQYRSRERSVNRCLNLVGEQCGIGVRLTMCVSRHSWASIAHSRLIPVGVISECMGHTSERVTSIYIKSLNGDMVNQANRKVIDGL